MLVNTGDPTIQELWNLVFMEKRRLADGSLEELPVKNVDCGLVSVFK
jgi:alanyl-tRNA synthetase